jgi:hypothetical protein
MTPGRCKGKAHQPEHLGIAGRRVLVSRKWSNKTLDVPLCSTSTRIAQRRVAADQSQRWPGEVTGDVTLIEAGSCSGKRILRSQRDIEGTHGGCRTVERPRRRRPDRVLRSPRVGGRGRVPSRAETSRSVTTSSRLTFAQPRSCAGSAGRGSRRVAITQAWLGRAGQALGSRAWGGRRRGWRRLQRRLGCPAGRRQYRRRRERGRPEQWF